MITVTKNLFDRISLWASEDVEELDGVAREIEARRTGIYRLTDGERTSVKSGLAQADKGNFVTDGMLAQADTRHGI